VPWTADDLRISLRGLLVQTAFDIARAEDAPRVAFLSLDDRQVQVSRCYHEMTNVEKGETPDGIFRTYNNSGATKTTLPMTFPLSSSSLALAASRIGNLSAMMGFI
jgi:hypothetical protein